MGEAGEPDTLLRSISSVLSHRGTLGIISLRLRMIFKLFLCNPGSHVWVHGGLPSVLESFLHLPCPVLVLEGSDSMPQTDEGFRLSFLWLSLPDETSPWGRGVID